MPAANDHGEVDSADAHASRRRLGEAQEQSGDGALAGSALADERDGLAGAQLELEPVEDEACAHRIGERDAFEPDDGHAGARCQQGSSDADGRRRLQQPEQPLCDREPRVRGLHHQKTSSSPLS